jgi:ubiquinone/menaquinone biosynthesis C-methylase UbiE
MNTGFASQWITPARIRTALPHALRAVLDAALPERAALAADLLGARYRAEHEAIRLPLVGAHRLAFAVAGQRTPRDHALEAVVRRRYWELLERELENVRRGLYPAELLFELPLRDYLRRLPRFVLDVPRVLARIRARGYRELPAEIELEQYPKYYRRTFHWQTDGYLSAHSAELYDLEVELLFVGCADVMRRQALAEVSRRRSRRPLRLLDVGAGTGRFLEQAARALPGSELHGLELSPYYARFAAARWARRPERAALQMTVGNAEALPFADQTFDVVTSIFLFHELPRRVRRQVLGEMRRVLRPGGLLVVEDAAQPADSPELAPVLQKFSRDLHEPFFRDYQQDDLGRLCEECGLSVLDVSPQFFAKVVSAEL